MGRDPRAPTRILRSVTDPAPPSRPTSHLAGPVVVAAALTALVRGLAVDDLVPSVTDCTAIYSLDDALVIPAGNGYYPGAFNVELRGLGHTSLLFSKRVHRLVRENLAAEIPASRPSVSARGTGAGA